MEINFKRLKEIITNKTNRAIEKLEEFKCTTPEYKNILASILNNLEAIKKLQDHDVDCPDCIEKTVEKPTAQQANIPVANPTNQEPKSQNAIGKEWIPFKENKK
jgi:hypothetical protein